MTGVLLRVENLHVSVGDTPIQGISLEMNRGEIHAIMGRNGAGKSTLANVIMGHPYQITSGTIHYSKNIEDMEVFERAREHVPLLPIPCGDSWRKLERSRKSVASVRGEAPSPRAFRQELNEAMKQLDMDKSFLSRYVNDGFSGGEKKRLEILQMLLLQPHLALLDETDSGLDIDALRIVAEGINAVAKDTGCLIITHYQRLLDLVKPDVVHVLIDGKIVESGGPELALKLEKEGYDWVDALA